MPSHENPQRQAEVFYPAGHPKHRAHPEQPTPGDIEQSSAPDLGDIIRGIGDLASELHQVFFSVPDVADETGRVDPEKFDASMQQAFISCGNALDYAVRLVAEKGRALRIMKLRRELAAEERAAGIPPVGESSMPDGQGRVG